MDAEEEEAGMDAEMEEAIRLTTQRISAALERLATERLGGPTAESTARYWAAVRGTNPSLGRLVWPPPFRMRASPTTRVQDEELRPRMESVVGEGGGSVLRMQEGGAAANAAQIGDEEDGREASSSPLSQTDASAPCRGICKS